MHVLNHKHLILNHIIKQVVVMLILVCIFLVFLYNTKKYGLLTSTFLLLALLKEKTQKSSSFSFISPYFKGFYCTLKIYFLKRLTFKEICKDLALSINSLLLGKSGLIFNGNAEIYKFTLSAMQPDTSHPFSNSLRQFGHLSLLLSSHWALFFLGLFFWGVQWIKN